MERIAHRGAKKELPENTVAAFSRAFERAADAIELDVHATRDGVVVVHHDASLRLPGQIRQRELAALAWAELSQVELAPGIGVPTLAQVLEAVPAGRTVYVEIKGSGIESLVALAIGADSRCAVHSFDQGTVARMRELAPGIPRGILFERAGIDVRSAMAETGARDVWPAWRLIDQRLVDEVHGAGGRIIAWTVNDAAVARRLGEMGVDGICTDDVRLL